MNTARSPNRRDFLTLATATIAAPGVAFAGALSRTPFETLGPYFPVSASFPKTHDLTHPPGSHRQAKGEHLHIGGRVLNQAGQPVPGAKIEIWQANAAGRYNHPSDHSGLPLDPNFLGLAVLESDTEGRYAFRTIRPGPYPAERGMRAPHIHFEVTGRFDRLVTQLYFPGNPLNRTDPLLRNELHPDALTLRIPAMPSPGAAVEGIFDIVLISG